jgi:L-threonine-O-3-phosphate decarboxylase
MLEHGGRLYEAARLKGVPLERWLDLSTGISPFAYPLPAVPARAWHRLPEQADGLLASARDYYGVKDILPIAGSQAVIQLLPSLFPTSTVGVIKPTYKEHPHAWRKRGHMVVDVGAHEILQAAERLDVLIICNPENPTGTFFDPELLLQARQMLADKGGLLIVDEAFVDVTPEFSILPATTSDGLLVLRSLGKFFGMGGARVGFVATNHKFLEKVDEELGPWTVTGPSRWAATQALADREFQFETKQKLSAASNRLKSVLTQAGLPPDGSTAFFQWVKHPDANAIFAGLQDQAVLARYYEDPASVRFGLPADDAQFERLAKALQVIRAGQCPAPTNRESSLRS